MGKMRRGVKNIHILEIQCSKCKEISINIHELSHSKRYYKNKTPGLYKCILCNNTRRNICLYHKDIGKKITEIIRY